MPRGIAAEIGTETVNRNGYTYVKTENGWRPKQELLAEEFILMRPIRMDERVKFRDGNQGNFSIDNLEVVPRLQKGSPASQLARITGKIEELEVELDALRKRKKELEEIVGV